ncbi:hypothetical protein CR513_55117, partial [Mucuna pruriens]
MDQVEERAQIAREEAMFWKDRYIKLALFANQAIIDILRSLRVVEGMVNPLNTLVERTQFLELYRRAANEDLRGEIRQLKEQMNKMLELLTRMITATASTTTHLGTHHPSIPMFLHPSIQRVLPTECHMVGMLIMKSTNPLKNMSRLGSRTFVSQGSRVGPTLGSGARMIPTFGIGTYMQQAGA